MLVDPIDPYGKIKVYVDGIEIAGVQDDGIPVPHLRSETATLSYNTVLEDEGQRIIDTAAHSDNEIHEYTVKIADIYTWIYEGKIINYKLLDGTILGADVKIKLCGKLKYIRGAEEVNRWMSEW